MIYDLYSRELSSKVKNAKRMRAEKGLFLSPFAPYGYVKDPENKNRLLVDEQAAAIVRKIFALTIDGVKPTEIAAMLNREGVPTPMLYKRAAGCSRERWPSIHEENFWTQGNIFKILRDERYIGKCVYGKRERDAVGNRHTVKRSKTDWVIVDETHEGIVSKTDFQKAAGRMKEYREFVPCISERNPLRKKVICGICGHAMSLSNTKNAKYSLTIAPYKGYGIICAVATLERIYMKYGYHVLDRTLRLCVGTWEGDIDSLGANILNAVARMVVAYGDQLRDETFKEKVGALSIRQLSRTAKERGGGSLSYAEAMLVAYNRKCKYTLKWSKLHIDKTTQSVFDDDRETSENGDE